MKSLTSGKDLVLKIYRDRLIADTINCLNSKKVMLKSLENSSQHLNPENILRRGFSITSINGKILKNIEEIKNDDMIDTQLYRGTLKSKVVEIKGRIG